MKLTGRAFIFGVIFIGMAAASIRFYFVSKVLHLNTKEQIVAFSADSPEYIELAEHMAATGSYGGPDPILRQFSLMRTPGYPAFCSLFALLPGSPQNILFAQAFLGALIATGTMLLARWVFSNDLIGILSGLASALSPTGIGLTGIFLVEILLVAGVLAGMLLLIQGVARNSGLLCVLAGVVFGISTLVKPTLVLWPFLSVPLWVSLSKNQDKRLHWIQAWLLIVPQILIQAGWCWHNYASHSVFSLSSIGAETTRYYLAARVEAWSLTGKAPADEYGTVGDIQHRLRDRDGSDWMSGRLTLAEIADRQTRESLEIFRKSPGIALRVYVRNIRESLTGVWDYYGAQIPDKTWLRRFLVKLNRSPNIPLGVQLMLAAASLAGFIPGDQQTRWKFRRWAWGGLALIMIPVYIGALSGTTFWVGSRIRYPGEFAQITLLLGGAWVLANRVVEFTRIRSDHST